MIAILYSRKYAVNPQLSQPDPLSRWKIRVETVYGVDGHAALSERTLGVRGYN